MRTIGRKGQQRLSLADLEKMFFSEKPNIAEGKIEKLIGPDPVARDYAIEEKGQPTRRTDVADTDQISYTSFDPPTTWNAPYSVQFVRFARKQKSDLMFHPGEELIFPVSGSIIYDFFWTPGGSTPKSFKSPRLRSGSVLRVNCQIPHHTSSVSEEASAWMVFRHIPESPAAISLPIDDLPHAEPRRRVTPAHLRKPGHYVSVAWGISEIVRNARLRAGLTTAELARQVGIGPSSLSRLEAANINISVELLLRICSVLRIGLLNSIKSATWAYDESEIPPDKRLPSEFPLLKPPPAGDHRLHSYVYKLAAGESKQISVAQAGESRSFGSWIVLEGRALFDLGPALGDKPVVLDAGTVIHFSKEDKARLQALKELQIVKITCADTCGCQKNAS